MSDEIDDKVPMVSVIIACHNYEKYIGHAIDSVLKQTFHDYEIIIVNDGSTDNTEEVVKEYLKDKRVKYIKQANAGQANAKNTGIRQSRGKFIAFLDADDLWTPDKLEVQLPVFKKSAKIGVVYTKLQLIDSNGRILETPQRQHHSGIITEKLLIDNFVTGMSSVIKRECLLDVGTFDESLIMGIDYDLWLRLSVNYEFYYIDLVTYMYRQWEGQMSHNFKERVRCAFKIMNNFLEKFPGIVNKKIIREAWAHTYVARGEGYAIIGEEFLPAFIDYLYAIKIKPNYTPAWKALIKLLIPGYYGKKE